MKADLSIVIATYNEVDCIAELLQSISAQTVQPRAVVIIDNSEDNAVVDEIEKYKDDLVEVYKQDRNLDFSRSYNLGITKTNTPYVLIMNPDMVLQPDALEKLLRSIHEDKQIAAVAPKLLRHESSPAVIDGMGITLTKSRNYLNIGENEEDQKQYDELRELFGVSGAAILLRRSALNDIAAHGGGGEHEYLDEDFIAYKDDVDLSYRLLHRGWKTIVQPSAVIYHKRTAKKSTGVLQTIRERKGASYRVRGYSYRNHLWTILKNEPSKNILLHFPLITWFELRKLIYMVLFEPGTLKIVPSFFKCLPIMLRKRKAILSSSNITAKYIRYWINRPSS